MANNVIDAAIRLRDLFTSTVRSVNASLGTMKAQLAAAKQSVSGLSDKLTEHERIQKRTAKSIEQTGSKISILVDTTVVSMQKVSNEIRTNMAGELTMIIASCCSIIYNIKNNGF